MSWIEMDHTLVRLTDRSSADRQPVWFPDDKRLAFTRSTATQPEAIFVLDLETQVVRRLTSRSGFDPNISPDGEFVVFTSLSKRGQSRNRVPCLWLHRISDGLEQPVSDCDNPEAFGSWTYDKQQRFLVSSRFQDDTNGDGRVDLKDRPALWRRHLVGWFGQKPTFQGAQPITSGVVSDIMPAAFGDRVYYASRAEEDLDIWSVALTGALEPIRSWKQVEALRAQTSAVQQAVFILRRCMVDLRDSQDAERCALALADLFLDLGRSAQAAQAYRLTEEISSSSERKNAARLGHIYAQMQSVLPLDANPLRSRERFVHSRRLLHDLSSVKETGGRRAVLRADILRRVGKWNESLTVLKRVKQGQADPRQVAQAALLRAEILNVLGDKQAALTCLVSVLKKHHKHRNEMLQAAKRILQLAKQDKMPSISLIELYENLGRRYKNMPVLSAMVRLEIGKAHLEAGRSKLAKRAFVKLEREYSREPEMVSQALLTLSAMAQKAGDLSQALDWATELLRRSGDHEQIRRHAQRRISKLASKYAEQLISQNETGLAIKVYRQLLEQNPQAIQAHRRIIALMAARSRTEECLADYEKRLANRPQDDLSHYLVGLALTYVDPPTRFEDALDEINKSISINAQSPFAYQTRAWIREQLFHLEGDEDSLHQAVEDYKTALSLLVGSQDTQAEADLLLNLGNVYFSLGNHRQAYRYYKRRDEMAVPFALPLRRVVFLQQFARSALLIKELRDALDAFSQAASLSVELDLDKRLPRLISGQATAYQLLDEHEKAAEYFGRACKMYQERAQLKNLVRCKRNGAYNHYMAQDFPKALDSFFQARELLRQVDVNLGSQDVVSVGITEGASEAASGFDARGELNLFYAFCARIWKDVGDLGRSILYQEKRTKLLQQKAEKFELDLAIALNNQAVLAYQRGRLGKAKRLFEEALGYARKKKSMQGMLINAMGLVSLMQRSTKIVKPSQMLTILRDVNQALQSDTTQKDRPNPQSKITQAQLYNSLGITRMLAAQEQVTTEGTSTGLKQDRIQSVLDRLDRSLDLLHKAQSDFTQAQKLVSLQLHVRVYDWLFWQAAIGLAWLNCLGRTNKHDSFVCSFLNKQNLRE